MLRAPVLSPSLPLKDKLVEGAKQLWFTTIKTLRSFAALKDKCAQGDKGGRAR
jgi:hypothetical protein